MFWKCVVLGASALVVLFAADDPAIKVVEEIAAKVNGDIVTRGELAEKHKEAESVLKAQGLTGTKLGQALKEADTDALSEEIDQLLLVQKAKSMPSLNVDPDVTKELNDMQAQVKIADPDKFHEFIREQTGMTFEEFKDRKKKELMAQRIVGYEVISRITIPAAEMQKYYDDHKAEFVREEQVYLSQILISTDGKTPEQAAAAETKAKDVSARGKRGEKFSDLARDYSDDLATAQNGGYLGAPSKRGVLRPELEAILFKEKKGFVTDPIKMTNPPGFLILKIEQHDEPGQASFEEMQERIHDILAQPKMQPKLREYLTLLRQDAYLQIKDGYVDSNAAPGKDTRWQEVAVVKPPTTTKEEVAARVHPHKKVLFVPIPGTVAKGKPVEDAKADQQPVEDVQPDNIPPPKPTPNRKPLPPAPAVPPIKQ